MLVILLLLLIMMMIIIIVLLLHYYQYYYYYYYTTPVLRKVMSDSLGDFPRESRKGVAVCFAARSTLGVYLVHGHRPDPSSPVIPRAGS